MFPCLALLEVQGWVGLRAEACLWVGVVLGQHLAYKDLCGELVDPHNNTCSLEAGASTVSGMPW